MGWDSLLNSQDNNGGNRSSTRFVLPVSSLHAKFVGEMVEFVIQVNLLHISETLKGSEQDERESNSTVALYLSEIERISCSQAQHYLLKNFEVRAGATIEDKTFMVNDESWNELEKEVTKFVKTTDRHLALASFLLKSQAFHETYEKCTLQSKELKPIIVLPRTRHKKPFIPARTISATYREENVYPLSISHQYPFAGAARLASANQIQPSGTSLTGFDIVVFDAVNPKLYDSVHDFVNVFRDSFAPSEWESLNDPRFVNDAQCQLHELYLRWAIKEAYTKALGVGMGFDFASFETVLDNKSSQKDPTWSIWKWISSSPTDQKCHKVVGTIRQVSSSLQTSQQSGQPKQEKWVFYFMPLFEKGARPIHEECMKGCGCLCIGPLSVNANGDLIPYALEVRTQWTSISELLKWHKSDCN